MKPLNCKAGKAADTNRRFLSNIHELLFSLCVASALVFVAVWGDGVNVPFVSLAGAINNRLGLAREAAVGGYSALLLSILFIVTTEFILLRLFSSNVVTVSILVYIAGFVALGSAPACWFYVAHVYSWYPAEVFASFLWAGLYLLRKWPQSWAANILVLLAHYGFWWSRYRQYLHHPIGIVLPLFGLLSCIAWTVYVPTAKPGNPVPHNLP